MVLDTSLFVPDGKPPDRPTFWHEDLQRRVYFLHWKKPELKFSRFRDLPAEPRLNIWSLIFEHDGAISVTRTKTIFPEAAHAYKEFLYVEGGRGIFLGLNTFAVTVGYSKHDVLREWLANVKRIAGPRGIKAIKKLTMTFKNLGPSAWMTMQQPRFFKDSQPTINDWSALRQALLILKKAGLEPRQLDFGTIHDVAPKLKRNSLYDPTFHGTVDEVRSHLFSRFMLLPLLRQLGLRDEARPLQIFKSSFYTLAAENYCTHDITFFKLVRRVAPNRHRWLEMLKLNLAMKLLGHKKEYRIASDNSDGHVSKLKVLRERIDLQLLFDNLIEEATRARTIARIKEIMEVIGAETDSAIDKLDSKEDQEERFDETVLLLRGKLMKQAAFEDVIGKEGSDETKDIIRTPERAVYDSDDEEDECEEAILPLFVPDSRPAPFWKYY